MDALGKKHSINEQIQSSYGYFACFNQMCEAHFQLFPKIQCANCANAPISHRVSEISGKEQNVLSNLMSMTLDLILMLSACLS